MTALADGGFVVTWQSDGQDGSGYGIYGQRYMADGTAEGSEFLVNQTAATESNFKSAVTLTFARQPKALGFTRDAAPPPLPEPEPPALTRPSRWSEKLIRRTMGRDESAPSGCSTGSAMRRRCGASTGAACERPDCHVERRLALSNREDFERLKGKMAVYIIHAVPSGECDPVRLGAKAVKACAFSGLSIPSHTLVH